MAIAVGSKAPDFTLKSSNGPGEKNDFGLSDITLGANFGEKNTVCDASGKFPRFWQNVNGQGGHSKGMRG